ncbi:hypothetical protein [Caulobacter sp. UNC358MFTsu5.1]|uniref:hypothetical protein n=1 Tax=Caulobacter sp. UNC358MFTsu5.1 TaxID=1449049 RepID=UPI0004A72013|nr:hypothetical protein [Caulobacter sp. UNC358MFTsu5.1]
MADAAAPGRFNTGRAVRRALAMLKRNIAANLAWAVVFTGLPDLAMAYANQRFSEDAPFGSLARWGFLVGTMLASMFGMTALQAVIARRTALDDSNRRASSRSVFGGSSDYLALATLGLVTGLGIVAGYALLAIPGIILSLAWFVVVPAMVTERLGVMESIRRSNALTREVRGEIFGLWVGVGILSFLAAWVGGLAIDALGIPALSLVVSSAIQAVIGLVDAILVVAVYQELRESQEGSPADRLVEVFA